MLTLQTIRENCSQVIEKLKVKNYNTAQEQIHSILNLDTKRREIKKFWDDCLNEQKKLAEQIGILFKQGQTLEANVLKEKVTVLKSKTDELSKNYDEFETQMNELLVQIPNLPHDTVPSGKTSEDNEIIYSEGNLEPLFEGALPHWDLVKKYDLVDFEIGTKICGAGFPIYKGKGVYLQRQLINFFLDSAIKAGYLEIQPPFMVNEASAYATGQLPDKDGQMYHAGLDNLYLIPTAEVPVTNIYRDTILKLSDFPVKNCAYSACFRREAGSYGKDVRGLNRLHQFDKVEIVQIQQPEKSYETLEEMKNYVTKLLQKLGLPFRILRLCGGDMSFASALTYDFEVYSKAQNRWLEVSSVSNFESFQANRLKLRFKDEEGKMQLAHTLNGSALALPRIMAAIIENYQTSDGIQVPDILIPYTKFKMIN